MSNLIIAVLLFLLCTQSFAQDVVAKRMKVGDIAQFTGVLLTDEKVKDLYKAEQKIPVLEGLRTADKELIEHYQTSNKDLRKKLIKSEFDSNMKSLGAFALGVILASLAFKTTQEITR